MVLVLAGGAVGGDNSVGVVEGITALVAPKPRSATRNLSLKGG